jgi:hypothetical protein
VFGMLFPYICLCDVVCVGHVCLDVLHFLIENDDTCTFLTFCFNQIGNCFIHFFLHECI